MVNILIGILEPLVFLRHITGNFFGGRAGVVKTKIGTYRNYYDEAKRNIIAQLLYLQGVKFIETDYITFNPKYLYGGVIYCDIPYLGTTGYGTNFNHEEFWEWAEQASETNIVLVSEQLAPEKWKPIWSQPVKRTLDNASRFESTESLFILVQITRNKRKQLAHLT